MRMRNLTTERNCIKANQKKKNMEKALSSCETDKNNHEVLKHFTWSTKSENVLGSSFLVPLSLVPGSVNAFLVLFILKSDVKDYSEISEKF